MEKKKGFIQEFKEFISRGSVMDLAIGVIIGSAFTAIVNSLVEDVIMPIIGIIIGKINFEDLKILITPASGDVAEVAVYYGRFIQNIVSFILIALVVFLIVKAINRFRRKKDEPVEEVAAEPEPSEETVLLREIRDLLKKNER
ncbi:MAG: large-conductance mechanosensitive channel protein MscL [Lachnospiraceae bacterium]|nr:large-conductance mechanosensitive channel protein MscL [Lachnospiraceae bacterium]